MAQYLNESVFFGVLLSLSSYALGMWLKKKFHRPWLNPLLISVIVVMLCIVLSGADVNAYQKNTQSITFLLTPATVCLAVPLYERFELLKKYKTAVLWGIAAGVGTSLCSVWALSFVLGMDHAAYVTMLPKSITTAIGMSVSEELGGHVAITVAMIIMTGIFGNIIAQFACRIFKITEPIAQGVALGSAAHAIGTTKAMEMGEIQGAMSSLSLALSGILTVLLAGIFSNFL